MLVDSHAHLYMTAFKRDRSEVISRAQEAGIGIIVNIGIDLPSSQAALTLAEEYPQLFATVGFHPHESSRMKDSDLAQLSKLSRHPKVVAIGEIGLDFYRNLSPQEKQREVFLKQLQLAREHDLPIVVHSRDAQEETLRLLTEWARDHKAGEENRPLGVAHCFSGNAEIAKRYLALGFVISIAGPITCPGAQKATEVARSVPLDKLIVETDCPFLTPYSHGKGRNEPAYLPAIVGRVAQIRGVSAEIIGQNTAQNAIRLFRLPTT